MDWPGDGWSWGCFRPEGPPDGRNAAIWVDLDEIDETPPRGEPGISPIMPDASRKRLRDMLGKTAETRKSQSDMQLPWLLSSPARTAHLDLYYCWLKLEPAQVKH